MGTIAKLYTMQDDTLSNDTIILSNNIYSEYIKDKDNFIIAKLPCTSYSRLVKLNMFNVLESSDLNINQCKLSSNIMIAMGLDYIDDAIQIIRIGVCK